MLLDPEARHDRDWLETKASDAFFEETPRYPDIAHVIVQSDSCRQAAVNSTESMSSPSRSRQGICGSW